MNQFIFCFVYDGWMFYGTLQAEDGRSARIILEDRFKERGIKVSDFGIQGVTSKTYQEASKELPKNG